MNKQMLIIKGSGNVGKSTTVKAGFELILKSVLKKQTPTSTKFLYLTGREVAAVIQVGTVRVGISTRGDNENEVKRALSFFSAEKCKIVICATRSKGAPYIAAQDFAHHKLKVEPTELVKESESSPKRRALVDTDFSKRIHGWATKALRVA